AVGGAGGAVARLAINVAFPLEAAAVGAIGGGVGAFAREMYAQRNERKKVTLSSLESLVQRIDEGISGLREEGFDTHETSARIRKAEEILEKYGIDEPSIDPAERDMKIAKIKGTIDSARRSLTDYAQA